jgi:phosphate transport system permease protein
MIKDIIAARVITLGGLTILLLLAAIVWHLLRVVLPLAQSPDIESQTIWHLPDNHRAIAIGDLDNSQPVWLVNDCALTFGYPSKERVVAVPKQLEDVGCQESMKIVTVNREQWLFRYRVDHQVIVEKLNASSTHLSRALIGHYSLELSERKPRTYGLGRDDWTVTVNPQDISLAMKVGKNWEVFKLSYSHLNEASVSRDLAVRQSELKGTPIEAEQLVLLPEYGQIAGLNTNQLVFYDESGLVLSSHTFDAQVSKISANESQRSVFVEMSSGQLQKWTVRNEQGHFIYTASAIFDVNEEIVSSLYSPNEQSALFLTAENELFFANMITGEILERQALLFDVAEQPKSIDWVKVHRDKLYIVSDTSIYSWLFYEHSPITTQALFSKVWYEGYSQPDYVWQSTPSNNQTEVKFSLVPLIIGSLKSALLAMVVAIPLALGAAIYTAYFSPSLIRNRLKPVIEFLEAIPSVVIGFVAAGWMATVAVEKLFFVIATVFLLPFVLWVIALVQFRLTRRLPKKWQRGSEWFVVSILFILLYLLIELLVPIISQNVAFFSSTSAALSHWNKSTLVVALALGIAIVPTIYSIAEDAIYEVPIYLRQASFALGATQLQTLKKVVLVAALPSIVSAIILGFSRAFGETILVLMITGNTPIADWDLLVGLRSMTANLAIELPEAEVNSTHYRVLFLTALILFVFTFVINTLAEWIRGNVRRRYRYV